MSYQRNEFGISESNNTFSCSVDGFRVPYTPGDLQSRKDAKAKVVAHATELQRKIESRIGRPLTASECLREEVSHARSDIFTMQQAKSKWDAIFAPPQEQGEENPFLRMLAAHEEEKLKKADEQGYFLKKKADAWTAENNRKLESEKLAKELASNPTYAKACAHAKATLLALRMDERASEMEIYEATQRVRACESGKIDLYETETKAFQKRYSEHLKTLAAPALATADRVRAEANELQNFTLEV